MSNRHSKFFYKPWVDSHLTTEIRYKNSLYKTKKKLNNEINNINYKRQKNKVTNLIRNKKAKYFKDYFEKYKNDTSRMWTGINLALEQSKRKRTLPDVIYDLDGQPVQTPLQKANTFAKYFQSVPQNAINKISKSNWHFKDYLHKFEPNSRYLMLYDCCTAEVKKHIMQLKDSSSTGPVLIPNKFLKLIANNIALPMSWAINKSLRTGYFPEQLKVGRQTPVFKSGEHSVQNFRPITVCSSFSKIVEKIVRDRLHNFLKSCNLLNDAQFGFRKGHSTVHATMNLLESTLDGLDTKLKVGGVYLDISKAFDCVDHDILLSKLEYYGIRDTALLWFGSYLSNRMQYVEVNGCKSEVYRTNISVPQGGVLSATLFILFTNDIVNATNKLKFSIYADDTCLIISVERDDYDQLLRQELNKVLDWFSANKLLLNINKTEYTFFGPHYPKIYEKGEFDLTEFHKTVPRFIFEIDYPSSVSLTPEQINKNGYFIFDDLHEVAPKYHLEEHIVNDEGSIIAPSDNVKYLGMYLDSKLNFKYHVSIVACKISRMVGTFWKCNIGLDLKTKKIIYHSLVESYINYGNIIYCSELSKNLCLEHDINHIPLTLRPIATSQNKIIRAIFRKPKYDKKNKVHTSMSPLYKSLEVLKFQDLYYYNLAIFAHDYFNDAIIPIIFRNKLDVFRTDSYHNTRNFEMNLNYNVPNLLNTYRKPTIACSMMWNRLPNELKHIKAKPTFKLKLKQFFLSKY